MLPQNPNTPSYTLEPLKTEGSDALTPAPGDGITAVKLRKLEVTWHNAFNKRTTTEADDLFRCAAAEDAVVDTIPTDAELTAATLEFRFEDSPDPRTVEIRPPGTVHTRTKEPRISQFLSRHHFLELALALLCPAFVEADPEDTETDRHTPLHSIISPA